MDILIHTLSGTIVATAIAAATNKRGWRKAAIVGLGAVAGALPDFDVISLWSGFDRTLGSWFNLPSGRTVYTAKYWYSHHAFLHSVVGDALCTVLFGAVLWLLARMRPKVPFRVFLKRKKVYLVTFFFAFMAHLLGDLPTPGAMWDGIALWWPSKSYVGGYGVTWWWNNYDVFLILLAGITANLILTLLNAWLRNSRLKLVPAYILVLALGLIVYQLNTRGFDFDYEQSLADGQFAE